MRRQLKQVRRTSRSPSGEGLSLGTPPTTDRERFDEVATLLARIDELVG